jgi:hypothetical protein
MASLTDPVTDPVTDPNPEAITENMDDISTPTNAEPVSNEGVADTTTTDETTTTNDQQINQDLYFQLLEERTRHDLHEQHLHLMTGAYLEMNRWTAKATHGTDSHPFPSWSSEEPTIIFKLTPVFPLQKQRTMCISLENKFQECGRLLETLSYMEHPEETSSGRGLQAWMNTKETPPESLGPKGKKLPFHEFEKKKKRLNLVFHSYLKLRTIFKKHFEKTDKKPFDMWLSRLANEALARKQGETKDEDDCCICLEPLGLMVKRLSCGHKVHPDCWYKWVDIKRKEFKDMYDDWDDLMRETFVNFQRMSPARRAEVMEETVENLKEMKNTSHMLGESSNIERLEAYIEHMEAIEKYFLKTATCPMCRNQHNTPNNSQNY